MVRFLWSQSYLAYFTIPIITQFGFCGVCEELSVRGIFVSNKPEGQTKWGMYHVIPCLGEGTWCVEAVGLLCESNALKYVGKSSMVVVNFECLFFV